MGTGGVASRHQVSIVALHDTFAVKPLHSRESIFGDVQRIVVAENIGILAYADIQPLVFRIPIQEGSKLLTGDAVIGAKLAVAIAAGNPICYCPCGCVFI